MLLFDIIIAHPTILAKKTADSYPKAVTLKHVFDHLAPTQIIQYEFSNKMPQDNGQQQLQQLSLGTLRMPDKQVQLQILQSPPRHANTD
jgi:hypothetical protein